MNDEHLYFLTLRERGLATAAVIAATAATPDRLGAAAATGASSATGVGRCGSVTFGRPTSLPHGSGCRLGRESVGAVGDVGFGGVDASVETRSILETLEEQRRIGLRPDEASPEVCGKV